DEFELSWLPDRRVFGSDAGGHFVNVQGGRRRGGQGLGARSAWIADRPGGRGEGQRVVRRSEPSAWSPPELDAHGARFGEYLITRRARGPIRSHGWPGRGEAAECVSPGRSPSRG